MTLIVVALTIAAALARGRRLRDLERVQIRHVWIFPAAVVLMLLLNVAKFKGWLTEEQTLFAQPSIYVVIIAGILLNRHIEGAMLLALGTFLNLLVIAANGGYMPVSMTALKASGLTMEELAEVMYLRHIPMDEGTRLAFLGDVIPVPWPPFLRAVGSVGDIVGLAAMVIIVWRLFFPSRSRSAEAAEGAL